MERSLNLPRESNVIFIGRKPPMSYVTAIITSFTGSDSEEVTLKARGRSITTAVDATEIKRRRFMKELNIDTIRIGTEGILQEDGGTRNVSTIEITLTRIPPEKKNEVPSTPSTELTNIEGIGAKRAESLQSHGVHSVQDLAKLDPEELSEKLQISEKRVSKWVEEAKQILNQ